MLSDISNLIFRITLLEKVFELLFFSNEKIVECKFDNLKIGVVVLIRICSRGLVRIFREGWYDRWSWLMKIVFTIGFCVTDSSFQVHIKIMRFLVFCNWLKFRISKIRRISRKVLKPLRKSDSKARKFRTQTLWLPLLYEFTRCISWRNGFSRKKLFKYQALHFCSYFQPSRVSAWYQVINR